MKKYLKRTLQGIGISTLAVPIIAYLGFYPRVKHLENIPNPSQLEEQLMDYEDFKTKFKDKPIDQIKNDPLFMNQFALEKQKFGFPEDSEEVQLIEFTSDHCYYCDIVKKVLKESGLEITVFKEDEAYAIRKVYGVDCFPTIITKKGKKFTKLYGTTEDLSFKEVPLPKGLREFIPCTINKRNLKREAKRFNKD